MKKLLIASMTAAMTLTACGGSQTSQESDVNRLSERHSARSNLVRDEAKRAIGYCDSDRTSKAVLGCLTYGTVGEVAIIADNGTTDTIAFSKQTWKDIQSIYKANSLQEGTTQLLTTPASVAGNVYLLAVSVAEDGVVAVVNTASNTAGAINHIQKSINAVLKKTGLKMFQAPLLVTSNLASNTFELIGNLTRATIFFSAKLVITSINIVNGATTLVLDMLFKAGEYIATPSPETVAAHEELLQDSGDGIND